MSYTSCAKAFAARRRCETKTRKKGAGKGSGKGRGKGKSSGKFKRRGFIKHPLAKPAPPIEDAVVEPPPLPPPPAPPPEVAPLVAASLEPAPLPSTELAPSRAPHVRMYSTPMLLRELSPPGFTISLDVPGLRWRCRCPDGVTLPSQGFGPTMGTDRKRSLNVMLDVAWATHGGERPPTSRLESIPADRWGGVLDDREEVPRRYNRRTHLDSKRRSKCVWLHIFLKID